MPALSPNATTFLNDLLERSVGSKAVPPTYLGVATDEETLYFQCSGERVFGEPDKGLVGENTMLTLFSCTKLVVTVSILQLLEQGVIDELDNPDLVRKYLPELWDMDIIQGFTEEGEPIKTPRTRPLTLKHILSHTSGLAYPSNPLIGRWVEEVHAPDLWSGTVGGYLFPLLFEPGSDWCYSVGSDWAGIFIERVTGKSLADYFLQNIFGPLELSSMTFYPTDEVKSKLQQTLARDLDGKLVHTETIRPLDVNGTQLSGGGGLFGTAKDYLRFLREILACLKGNSSMLSAASATVLFDDVFLSDDSACHTALAKMGKSLGHYDPSHLDAETLGHSIGLVINTTASRHGRAAGSGGWYGAAQTQYWLDPETGLAGICFTQLLTEHPDSFIELYNQFERAVYDGLT